MLLIILEFLLASSVIVLCGSRLAKYGDVIAEKTGLGGAFIGIILMASVTSLPELITGISSVAFANTPDIAVGDVLGSCVFNLMILALLDPIGGKNHIFSNIGRVHLVTAGFGVVLMGIVSISILLGPLVPSIGHVGLYTPVIIVVYVVSVMAARIAPAGGVEQGNAEASDKYADVTLQRALAIYAINAVFVVAAAVFMPFIADRLSAATGLGNSFVGTALVAMTTSLPELVVTASAIRMGAYDMAAGDIFGSNVFNVVILAVDDLFYVNGSLLSAVSASHAVTGVMAMVMTGVAIAAMACGLARRRYSRMGIDSAAIVALWVATIYLSYAMR